MVTTLEKDVLIVGGGLVGASFALALQQAEPPLTVALVEAVEPLSKGQPSFDDRSTVLSQASVNLMKDMDLWHHIEQSASAIRHIHTSDQGKIGFTRFQAKDYGLDAMGYVVDNRTLGTRLYEQVQRYDAISVITPCRVTALDMMAEGVSATLSSSDSSENSFPERIQARLVVLCDGGRSGLAEQIGLTAKGQDYQQNAIIANVQLERAHEHWAYERFTADGPIAMLPLPDFQAQHRCALIWTTPEALLTERLSWPDERFLTELQLAFGYRLGRLKQIGVRHHYPLKVQAASELIRSRLAVLGNAAHTLHPVAGQGLNLALRGSALLAAIILEANASGQDIGSLAVLSAYALKQEKDAQRIQMSSDGLVRLFSSDVPWLTKGRNAGLVALDLCPTVKGVFARAAMGLDVQRAKYRAK